MTSKNARLGNIPNRPLARHADMIPLCLTERGTMGTNGQPSELRYPRCRDYTS